MSFVQLLAFLSGAIIVAVTLRSAISTFIVPRSIQDKLTRAVFISIWLLFRVRLHWARDYYARDRVGAFFAPLGLLLLLIVWYILIMFAYTLMFWAVGVESWYDAFRESGSSLLTLGFAVPEGLAQIMLAFSEAIIGLILVALLISYLPTMYGAFQKREVLVTMLEVRAGLPPSAITLIERAHRIRGFDRLNELWRDWEWWFSEIQESHSSLPMLVFFRSPRPEQSWITASGAILDSATLINAAVDVPHDAQADLCIRAGYLALRQIADYFNITYNPNPTIHDDISVTREEFDSALDDLQYSGVPLKPDRERAWLDFKGWRVNYDTVLLALCSITLAPYTPWSSDRARMINRPWFMRASRS